MNVEQKQVLARLGQIAVRLRETADGLKDGSMHRMHAYNRLKLIADEIDGGGKGEVGKDGGKDADSKRN